MPKNALDYFDFNEHLIALALETEKEIITYFAEIAAVAEHNQAKVIKAFHDQQVSDFHFNGSSGYGYDDAGRETLEKLYADVMGAEASLVRPHIVSGTHAISLAYFGLLRPGDELLMIGQPYDTLNSVLNTGSGSLKEWNIDCRQVDIDSFSAAPEKKISAKTKMVSIQRSRGYRWENSLNLSKIKEIIEKVNTCNQEIICFVDNCYGEFVETKEPLHCGADLIAGSLIKNPGGGLANGGGYLAGKSKLIEKIAHRLYAPGLGTKMGAVSEGHRLAFQGLFFAPQFVGEALKGAIFGARLMEKLGLNVSPKFQEKRTDIIQAVRLPSEKALIAFCQGVQKACIINAHHLPEPSLLPGYQERIIMAAGGFVQGGSLELSCDAPLRSPFTAYFQGGLSYFHAKLGILSGLNELFFHGILK